VSDPPVHPTVGTDTRYTGAGGRRWPASPARTGNAASAGGAHRATRLLERSGGVAPSAAGPARLRPLPRSRRDENAFDTWLAVATQRLDPLMTWLGVLFALLVVVSLAARLRPVEARVINTGGWVIWGIFAGDFAAKLWLAPHRGRFLRKHWLALLMLLIPTLRVLRLAALLRLGRALPAARVVSSSYRAAGTARRLLGSRIGYLGGVSSLAVVVVAELVYLTDRPRTFGSFTDALLWALAVVIGEQGDPTPATRAGRLVMAVGFAAGAVLIATLAGTIGAYLLEGRRERAAQEQTD
jgi:voltage-gated potassium channel